MLNQIIQWAIAKRFLVVIALLVVLICTILAIPRLNLDAFPDVTNVQVSVNTEAPGLATEEVEQLITFPIEAVMYALPDVKEVRSVSKTGLSGITVVFNEGVDIYFARQLVFERLQTAKELIPEGVATPEMGPNTSGLGQVYQYLLVADKDSNIDITTLRSLNDWVVKLLLMPVDGVTNVLSFGGKVKQYQVNINPNQLLAYGLTQQDVIEALEKNNSNVSGWYLNQNQEQLVVRGIGWLQSDKIGLNQIRQIPVKMVNGIVVKIENVAVVEIGSEIRQGAVSMTKRNISGANQVLGEVVAGIVLKRIGANTQSTIDGIKTRIPLINQALPKGVKFEVYYDQADLIKQAIATVVDALLFAFVLIVIVLALFLMNLRATFLVLISIPISIGIALMIMSWLGLSANLMSLGGLAVAIGMLVDGSVVIVENIVKSLQAGCNQEKSFEQRLMIAGNEVSRSIFFATLIILVVFIPLFSFEGVEAKLFEPMAISIILAIVAALLVALIVVPALAALLFKRPLNKRKNIVIDSLEDIYHNLLGWIMSKVKQVIFTASLLLMSALLLIPKLGSEFVPELEEGTINLRVTLGPTANLNTSLKVASKLESLILTLPEVDYALSRIGRPELGGDPEPVNNIEIYIGLKPVSQWKNASNRYELQDLLEKKLIQHPGILLNFSQPVATRVDELLSGVKAQLAIKLFGPELNVLAEKGQLIQQLVKSINGTKDVAMEQLQGEAQLIIKPDRKKLSRYGMSVADVMRVVSDGIGGKGAGQIIKGNERYDINVRLAPNFRKDKNAISNIRMLSPTGAWVTLGSVASIKIDSGPPQIRRDDVQRRIVIQANVVGRDMGNVVREIKNIIDEKANLPTGYNVAIGGQFESQVRAQKKLLFVVPMSLILIALLLYFAFNSFSQALLILINIPLAMIGGIFSLYFSQQYLSVPSSVGFITLFGVAVLNGVVMVESINQRVIAGLEMSKAILNGAVSRLRPVLMTAMTSSLGLLPMLMSSGVGAEIQRPLASVIIGGLITSTLLTLLVIPTLYPIFSKAKLKNS